MYTGSLPPTSIHGTWVQDVQIYAGDDEVLADLSTLTEITLKLRDPRSRFDDMTLTMSNGDITVPSQGTVQWRAEAGAMGRLSTQLYEVLLLLEDDTDTVPLVIGTISIVE